MKRFMAALLVCALALCASALADTRLSEVQMLYEDYDGNQANQTVADEATLEELEQMLMRARKTPGELEGCTMNCTLLCTLDNGEIYDIAVATDGCPYIYSELTKTAYSLGDDYDAFWAIFGQVREGMGFDASSFFDLDNED